MWRPDERDALPNRQCAPLLLSYSQLSTHPAYLIMAERPTLRFSRFPHFLESSLDHLPVIVRSLFSDAEHNRNEHLCLDRMLPGFLQDGARLLACARSQPPSCQTHVSEQHTSSEQPPEALFKPQFILHHEMGHVVWQAGGTVEALHLQQHAIVAPHKHLIVAQTFFCECNFQR